MSQESIVSAMWKFLDRFFGKKPPIPPELPPDAAFPTNSCGVAYCFLETHIGSIPWNEAYEKAVALNFNAGKPPGLYPFKWDAHDGKILLYYYDMLDFSDPRIGFFAWTAITGTLHMGIYDASKEHSVANKSDIFTLHKIFRSELLGIKMPSWNVEKKK